MNTDYSFISLSLFCYLYAIDEIVVDFILQSTGLLAGRLVPRFF